METNNFQTTPQTNKKEGSVGPIIGSVIIILLIIMGGLYFWGSIIQRQNENAARQRQMRTEDLSGIEKDLNETNIDTLDSEMDSIEAELDAALE